MEKKLIVLSASLGGPPLVNEILSSLAPSFELPLLVLQQMESDFSEPLTSAWGKTSSISLFRLENEVNIREGFAYVIPYGTYPCFEGSGENLTAKPMPLKNGSDFYGQWDMVIGECIRKFQGDLVLIILTDFGLDINSIDTSLKNVVRAGGTIIHCRGADSSGEQEDWSSRNDYLEMEIDQIITFLQKISGGKFISV